MQQYILISILSLSVLLMADPCEHWKQACQSSCTTEGYTNIEKNTCTVTESYCVCNSNDLSMLVTNQIQGGVAFSSLQGKISSDQSVLLGSTSRSFLSQKSSANENSENQDNEETCEVTSQEGRQDDTCEDEKQAKRIHDIMDGKPPYDNLLKLANNPSSDFPEDFLDEEDESDWLSNEELEKLSLDDKLEEEDQSNAFLDDNEVSDSENGSESEKSSDSESLRSLKESLSKDGSDFQNLRSNSSSDQNADDGSSTDEQKDNDSAASFESNVNKAAGNSRWNFSGSNDKSSDFLSDIGSESTPESSDKESNNLMDKLKDKSITLGEDTANDKTRNSLLESIRIGSNRNNAQNSNAKNENMNDFSFESEDEYDQADDSEKNSDHGFSILPFPNPSKNPIPKPNPFEDEEPAEDSEYSSDDLFSSLPPPNRIPSQNPISRPTPPPSPPSFGTTSPSDSADTTSCTSGHMRCVKEAGKNTNKFDTCVFERWGTVRECAPGTECRDNGDHILCAAAA